MLTGQDTNWSASAQTGIATPIDAASGQVRGAAVRVLLRGEDMVGGSWIQRNGGRSQVCFRGGAAEGIPITRAYIGECDDAYESSMDIEPGTQTALTFGGSAGITIPAGGSVWSDMVDFPIDNEKSYLVTCLLGSGAGGATLSQWTNAIDPSLDGTYIIPPTSVPGAADAAAETWSGRGDVTTSSAILGVEYLYASYPQMGTYISSVFDTHCDTPGYTEVNVDALVPSGTDLRIKVRTGDEEDMSDAPAWTNVPAIPIYGLIDPGNRRFIQFLAEIDSDGARDTSPKLREVTIKWNGPERAVDIGGTFTRGPDYGQFELTVDDQEIVTAVSIDLEIFREMRTHKGSRMLTSQATAEVEPRNTGL
jgi:hypothetical protein